jgi:hypothetical protein
MIVDWAGLGKVLGVGLIAAVGLVSLYALGVRILATAPAGPRPPLRTVAATACFAGCAAVAGYGLVALLGS